MVLRLAAAALDLLDSALDIERGLELTPPVWRAREVRCTRRRCHVVRLDPVERMPEARLSGMA